ncbi:ABC transporter permease [Spiroplasma floricola]|uniref:Ribose/galactose ABC transporter permease n=1 Tax=Spiroplasma floricola 23-6 TaxID=1336749 RepID=A0A2K8SD91_9MOLU|nr:ABC transporter permease [Spiroplasma floricola]AUB31434.1 ribose/galactose ABC transporter permease [Spiroplasma floricola 23-6]
MAASLMENFSLYFAVFALAATSGLIAERSGVVNVGIEGFMIIGGLLASLVGSSLEPIAGNGSQIIALLVGALFGGLLSLLHSFASIKLKADQIVSGTAINLLAQGFGLYIATTGSTFINGKYTIIALDSLNIISIYLIITIIITLSAGLYFTFTKPGMRHIAAGENPNALEAAGVNVIKYRVLAVFVSGCIAALAGGIYIITVKGSYFRGTADGFGFLALAIMIVGQWRIKFVAIASAAFAFFFALSKVLPLYTNSGWLTQNKNLFLVLPFVLSLGTMIVLSKWSKPPAAVGIPYDKSKR